MKKALIATVITSSLLSSTAVFAAQLTPINPQAVLDNTYALPQVVKQISFHFK
ncbi:hypothetical protein [Aliivibrio logei]|uniref:hypothetical protein n=1 Tax=Aliivibrio logei TaxID=688 RepID=UPI0035C8E508